jgi:hypothetical protein
MAVNEHALAPTENPLAAAGANPKKPPPPTVKAQGNVAQGKPGSGAKNNALVLGPAPPPPPKFSG